MRGKAVGGLVVVLALSLAGCGGSSELSRADLVKQANAICKDRQAGIEAVRRGHMRDMPSFMAAALPVADKSLDELDALKPPKALQAKYDEFVAGARAQIDQVKRALAALRAHRRPGQGQSIDAIHRQGRITRELGLDACV